MLAMSLGAGARICMFMIVLEASSIAESYLVNTDRNMNISTSDVGPRQKSRRKSAVDYVSHLNGSVCV